MIAAVTTAEKHERTKEKQVEKLTLGYDPTKWTDTDLKISSGPHSTRNYQTLDLPPPTTGHHRYTFCQNMYREVHEFLLSREWAPTNPEEENVGGITWAELFILFDISGKRTAKGEHVVGSQAQTRAEQRNPMSSKGKQTEESRTVLNAIPKPFIPRRAEKVQSYCTASCEA